MAMDAIGAGLGGAFGYGCADFAGGRASRVLRTPNTAAIAQFAALVVTLLLTLSQTTATPSFPAVALATAAGVAYAAGLMLLYRGFAEGCISLVAPTAGLVAVLVPVLASLALFDRPSDLRVIGLMMAALSVVLLGGSTGARSRARFSLTIGTLSGLGYGSADLALGVLPPEDMPGSICIIRLVATLCALAVLVGVRLSREAAGQPRVREMARTRMGWDAVCLAVSAGLLDAFGHQGFALSAASGQVALAAALTALHPLVSIVLSVVILGDRIGRVQLLGSLTSIASMVLLVA